MLSNLDKYKIILASGSPRRRELMTGLGVNYEVKTLPGIDESYPLTLKGEEIPLYIAKEKAAAYLSHIRPDELIITADTIVWIEQTVLGKPSDNEQAKAMLRRLSGKTHEVITGVCLTTTEFQQSFTTTTEVTFASLTEDEITYYVENYHPLDKAGAYGIQEWIGFVGVTGIQGSYFNVMGLPIQRLYKELAKL
ncbi:MAG: Maf-like protein [Bacteroidaceae bacterium]